MSGHIGYHFFHSFVILSATGPPAPLYALSRVSKYSFQPSRPIIIQASGPELGSKLISSLCTYKCLAPENTFHGAENTNDSIYHELRNRVHAEIPKTNFEVVFQRSRILVIVRSRLGR